MLALPSTDLHAAAGVLCSCWGAVQVLLLLLLLMRQRLWAAAVAYGALLH